MKTNPTSIRSSERRFEAGDTLIEVLLALSIIAITAVAILASFSTALGASAEETSISQINTYLKSYAEVATVDLQEDSPALYTSCATAATYTSLLTNLPSSTYTSLPSSTTYKVTLASVDWWNPTSNPPAFSSTSCTSGSTQPQLLTLTATGPKVVTESLSFVITDYTYVQPAEVAPKFSVSSPFTYTQGVGTSWTYTLTTSAGSPTPALTSSALPAGVTFVDNGNGTGTLSGSTTVAAGSYNITFTANNSVAPSASLTFNLIIASAPVFTSSNAVSFASGAKISFAVSATDTDSQPPALALDSTLSGPLKNLTFVDNGNGTATLAGTLVSGTTGTYSLEFEADNSVGVATTQTLVITIPTTPVFTSASSVTWQSGATVQFTVSAVDTDTSSPTLALTAGKTGAVANLTFVDNGNGTGSLSGKLTSGSGAYSLTLQATNSAGQTTSQTLKVEVTTLPVFTSASSASEKSGGSVAVTVSATDTDTASPTLSLTSTLSGECKNLNFVNNGNGTGTLSGTLVSGNGTCSLTFQATNSAGGSTTQSFTLYIPTAPVFTSATTASWKWFTSENFTISATDADDSAYPTFVLNTALTGALSSFTFVDNGNGTATLKGNTNSSTGTYSLKITSTNSAGVSTVQTLVITVAT